MNDLSMTRATIIASAAILIIAAVPAVLAVMAGVVWAGVIFIAMGALSLAGLIAATIHDTPGYPGGHN